MKSLQDQIDHTYGSGRLANKLLESLHAAGVDTRQLTTRDLIAFDELHVMGRQATMALGRLAGLGEKMQVLDIGSGLGGPARTLAHGFGCHVTGVDLSAEFVAASDELTRRVGLESKVGFRHADALALPFEGHRFDAVFMIHLNMNIEDKKGLFNEARRVLKSGARLILWEICAGRNEPVIYPVPWAESPAFSYLMSMPDMLAQLQAAGFADLRYDDATDEAISWVQARLAAMEKSVKRPPRPDLDLILKDFRKKRTNITTNLLKKRIRILRASGLKP